MAKYLYQAHYNTEGAKAIVKEGGSSRRAAVEKAIQSVGGTLEVFYFAFGDTDLYAIADVPNNTSAMALALAVNTSGTVSVTTTPLLSVDEVDAAIQLHPSYRAPGQ